MPVTAEWREMASITLDAGTQARVGVSEEKVEEYRGYHQEAADSGLDWPERMGPLDVFEGQGSTWLADGFHRFLGREAAGLDRVLCHVHKGTRRDALLFAVGANAAHGLPRSPADKRNAVAILLADDEWCGWSVQQLASAARVSWSLANEVREGWLATSRAGSGEGDEAPTPAPEADATRTYSREGQVRQMDTSRIGKGRKAEPAKPEPVEEEPTQTKAPPAVSLPTDRVGVPLEGQAAADAFAALSYFRQVETCLRQAQRAVAELATLPGGERYRQRLKLESRDGVDRFHCPDLANALRELLHARPHASRCPACDRDGPAPHKGGCKVCLGLPYVLEDQWDRAPAEWRGANAGGER